MLRVLFAALIASLVGCVESESVVNRSTLPIIQVSSAGSAEGQDIILFVSLTKAIEEDVQFDWTTESGGTATEGVDYQKQSGSGLIAAGFLSTSIVIQTTADADDETNETIQVRLFNMNNVEVGNIIAEAEIIDDDTPDISVNDSSGPEGSNITFTATLNRTSAKNVSFQWTTSDVTTTAGSDYNPVIAVPATIPAGSLTTTINVSALADSYDDADNGEIFNINIGSVVNATITDGVGTGTISDSDVPQISINDIVTVENTVAAFSVSIDIASEQNVSVNWTTANGTASAPGDYVAASGTATIPAGSLSTVVNVSTFNNSAYETPETFVVNLSAPVNGTILDNQGIATINDDDSPPSLAIDSLSFVEGSIFSFTVTLTGSTEVNTQFDWATSNGSALSPGDYTAGAAAGVTILAGNTTATINVTSLEDLIDEPTQTFNVTLSNPVNASLGTPVGIGNILDNEAPPNLSINDALVTEGGVASFTVTLDTTSEANIGFDIATSDVTASAGSDYTSNTASLVINAGLLTQTFNVSTTDDGTACEGAETLNVNVTNAPAANIVDGLGVATLNDNDPSLSIDDVVIAENGGSVNFTITPSAICGGANIDVDWTTANNTALSPGDYTASAGTATILAGNPNVTVSVPISNDGVSELDETFFVNLSNPINAVILDNQGLGTINDDDTVPNISVNDDTITEGANATVTVSLSAIAGSDITVDYTTVPGTAVAVNDFTATAGTLTIPAGSLSQNILIPTNDDTTEEANKNFTLVISNPNLGNIIDTTSLITLNDNDAIPDITVNDVAIAEGGNLVFTVSLSNPSEDIVSFNWTTVDGTATAPGDYTSNSAVGEAITPGNTTTTLTVATIDNALDGNNKNLTVSLSAAANGTIIDNIGLGTITDNDPTPTLSINNQSVVEGGALAFTVTLSAASENNVNFNWATSDGSAVNPSDYVTAGATETITAGNTAIILNVTGADDALYEADETFNVTLSAPVNATIATGTGVGTVLENETPPTLSIDNPSAAENGSLSFTVSLSFLAQTAVSVNYGTSDGTAIGGSDYSGASGTLVIPATNPSGVITVNPIDDNLTEVSENMTVTLSAPVNASIAVGSGSGTITDNDAILMSSGLTGAEDVNDIKISPDSSRVVYLSDELNPGTFELFSVAPDGTGRVKISGTLVAGGNVTSFDFSPDSSKVVFIADAGTDEDIEIYSVNLNGTGLTNITGTLAAGGDIQDFKVRADSGAVIFRGDKTTNGTSELYSVALTGGAVTTLNSALVAGGNVGNYAISGDSSKVVFIADRDTDEEFELYSVNNDGTGEAQLNSALTVGGDVQSFEISGNSSLVAFIADKDTDNQFEVFSVAIAGGVNDQVNAALVAGGDVNQFAWSANSSKIVYLADENSDEVFELFSADSDGSNQASLSGALVAGGDVQSFEISADSTQVVYLADENIDTVNEVFSSPIAGGGSTRLNTALILGEAVQSYAISADSNKVVYIADEATTGEFELRSINLNGTGNTPLSGALVAGGDVHSFKIASDSSKILYLADKTTDFQNEIYSVAMGGGVSTKINSDLVAGGNVEADFKLSNNSVFCVYRADYSTDDTTDVLKHNF